jgi:trypsin
MKLTNLLLATAMAFAGSNAFASTNNNSKLHMKIVGGVEASRGEFPFIVSLQANYMGHFCGGSLIKKNWVLTAGHCVTGTTIDKILIGLQNLSDTKNAEVMKVKRIIRHPQYNENTTDYDFALIELTKDSAYTPVALNTSEINIPDTGDTPMATVAGWGATNENSYSLPNELQKVEVPLVSHNVCNNDYKGVITDRMICAGYEQGGKDSCQGDSGGPLVAEADDHQRYLIGVVSWGEGCARAGLPGVYSKVNFAVPWINNTTK